MYTLFVSEKRILSLKNTKQEGVNPRMPVNDVISVILNRKGVKKYKSDPVPMDLLETIVTAGTAAPNAFNRQAWLFTVVTDKEILKEIDTQTNLRLHECPSYHALYGAPALSILSSAKDNIYARQDCSAANQNMALAAKSLGIASRFLDVPNLYLQSEEGKLCRERCGIPENYQTVCFLCLGYSDEPDSKPTPKRTDVVYYI